MHPCQALKSRRKASCAITLFITSTALEPLFYQSSLHQLDADEEGSGFEEDDVEKIR